MEDYCHLQNQILESNSGILQQVLCNETDMLNLLTADELSEFSDIGLNLFFLAVYHNKPQLIRYLWNRGIDIHASVDPLLFGNAYFYAVTFGHIDVVATLHSLGCDIDRPCNSLQEKPLDRAKALDNLEMEITILKLLSHKRQASILFEKNVMRLAYKRRYIYTKSCIVIIQKHLRMFHAKLLYKRMRPVLARKTTENFTLDDL